MKLRDMLIGLMAAALPGVLQGSERPVVERVRVEGARRVPEDRVRGWLVTRPGLPADSLLLRKDMDRVLAGYRDAGFWQAAVWFPEVGVSRERATVTFRVAEGRPTRIDTVAISGNRNVALDTLLAAMSVRAGTGAIPRRVEAGLEALLRVYENRGYPYCALSPELRVAPGEDAAHLQIRIDEGPFVRVDTVRFTGNRVTREEVLLREARMRMGEPYDQRRVDRAVQALRRLPFLLDVEGVALEPEEDGGTALVVAVREAPAGRMEGGLGYAADAGGASQGLTGAFALAFENLLGTGRSGGAAWARQGPDASDLELRYRESWILGRPFSAEAHLGMRQRPGYAENRAGAAFAFTPAPNLELRMGFSRSGVQPDSSGPGRVLKSRVWALEGGAGYDRRDDRWNPMSGFRYGGRFAWGRVARSGGGHVRVRYALDMDHFLPVSGRSALAFGLHGAGVYEAGGVPPEARLRLGGTRTIRGHREEAFLADRAAWANVEWRVPVGRRSRAFLFFDAGALDAPGAGADRYLFPFGFGFGLRAASRLGTMGLDYGLTAGDSPGQGKVHVQMVNEF